MSQSVLAIAKVRRSGNSTVFVIPKIVREAMGIVEGDTICMRVHLPYATFCRWPPAYVPRLAEIPAPDRPPLDPRSLRNAPAKDSAAQPTDRAAEPDSRSDGR
jgi:bifunctional DNA-binding transcriptional regulator/antitoxin component of YhaV-PrlF toxin-antitoxin module